MENFHIVSETNDANGYTITFRNSGHVINILSASVVKSRIGGWKISAKVKDDYYKWVEDFSAVHPQFGKVCGDFSSTVHASSKEAYEHFVMYAKPHEFDLWDI